MLTNKKVNSILEKFLSEHIDDKEIVDFIGEIKKDITEKTDVLYKISPFDKEKDVFTFKEDTVKNDSEYKDKYEKLKQDYVERFFKSDSEKNDNNKLDKNKDKEVSKEKDGYTISIDDLFKEEK